MKHKKVYSLWKALHACPEISGKEMKTKQLLLDFIKTNTTLEIHPCGGGFYAAHLESNISSGGIAFRADYDALACPDGSAAHLCGHDGHAAALCLAALELEGKSVGRNVFILFQPAEETGAGAYPCCELFQLEEISEIYGIHNLPGYNLGQVFTRFDTFACGSMGLTIRFIGKATHAAYPENGISPAPAVADLLSILPQLSNPKNYTGMVLCTVIGVSMGEKAFGAAAANAELWLTLRAEKESDLEGLFTAISKQTSLLATKYNLAFDLQQQDVFPATENDASCVQKLLKLCNAQLLEVPMRWSEDFGHYLQHCKGAYLGIGAGIQQPALHTDQYIYPTELLVPTANVFIQLLQ